MLALVSQLFEKNEYAFCRGTASVLHYFFEMAKCRELNVFFVINTLLLVC